MARFYLAMGIRFIRRGFALFWHRRCLLLVGPPTLYLIYLFFFVTPAWYLVWTFPQKKPFFEEMTTLIRSRYPTWSEAANCPGMTKPRKSYCDRAIAEHWGPRYEPLQQQLGIGNVSWSEDLKHVEFSLEYGYLPGIGSVRTSIWSMPSSLVTCEQAVERWDAIDLRPFVGEVHCRPLGEGWFLFRY
ncbi:MAG: hypothetical protein HQL56_15520 [Magnetococcales bacterium]|nr:hypothetical protein [Magnetococcales bacterium]